MIKSPGQDDQSSYFLSLYRDLYYREAAIAQNQMGRIGFPITIAVLLVGGVSFIFRELSSLDSVLSWGNVWWWSAILSAIIAAVFSAYAVVCVIRSAWPRRLASFPLPSEIEQYVTELRVHNAAWAPNDNSAKGLEIAVDRWLQERYRDGANDQALRNRKRGTYLALSLIGLSISSVFILIGFGFLTGVYLMRPSSASLLQHTGIITSEPPTNSLSGSKP